MRGLWVQATHSLQGEMEQIASTRPIIKMGQKVDTYQSSMSIVKESSLQEDTLILFSNSIKNKDRNMCLRKTNILKWCCIQTHIDYGWRK